MKLIFSIIHFNLPPNRSALIPSFGLSLLLAFWFAGRILVAQDVHPPEATASSQGEAPTPREFVPPPPATGSGSGSGSGSAQLDNPTAVPMNVVPGPPTPNAPPTNLLEPETKLAPETTPSTTMPSGVPKNQPIDFPKPQDFQPMPDLEILPPPEKMLPPPASVPVPPGLSQPIGPMMNRLWPTNATPAVRLLPPQPIIEPVVEPALPEEGGVNPIGPAVPLPPVGLPTLPVPVPGVVPALAPKMPPTLSTGDLEVYFLAPEEIVVQQPALYTIHLRNISSNHEIGAEVKLALPPHTRLLSALPKPMPDSERQLHWYLSALAPQQEVRLRLEILPMVAKPISLPLQVHAVAHAELESIVTQPQLQLLLHGPPQVMVGDEFRVMATVVNSGTGTCRGGIVEFQLTDGLRWCEPPRQPNAEPLQLMPGQSVSIPLHLQALQVGTQTISFDLQANGGIHEQIQWQTTVQQLVLALQIRGPAKGFVGLPYHYEIEISNPGEVAATNTSIFFEFPSWLEITALSSAGKWNQEENYIYWRLDHLPAKGRQRLPLTALAHQAGLMELRASLQDERGNVVDQLARVRMEGQASIELQFQKAPTLLFVGETAQLHFHLRNVGSAVARKVELQLELPPELLGQPGQITERSAGQWESADGGKFRFHLKQDLPVHGQVRLQLPVLVKQANDVQLSLQLTSPDIPGVISRYEPLRLLQASGP